MKRRLTLSPKVIFLGLIGLILLSEASASFPYYGTKIGALKRLHHGVSGDVYAVDSRTIFIKSFNYDGEAPAAYFYVGNTAKPSNEGAHRLRDERGGTASLTRRYRNKDITLSLPEGKTLRDIKWFSVWCDEFSVNFGDVVIPSNLDFPRPQKINALKGVHAITSDNIVIVDAQTLLVPNLSYDGIAPDAKFWVGRGQQPTPQGLRIPDENGKEDPLRRYDHKTIVLTLPGDLTIFDIGHFGIWCEAFTVDFAHVLIPDGLNVPPSLKMLGISPQSKLNCEVLYDDLAFEVRWAVAGESIVIQLVAKLGDNEYMAFGISPKKDQSQMIGADAVVAWVDKATGNGFAQDYYLDDKSQCSGGRGSCPDVKIEKNTNSIRLLNAAMVNGYSIVTYQRSLKATDHLDLPISLNGSEAIVWAIGPLNERKETSFHTYYTKNTQRIDFGRQPTWNCPMPEGAKPIPTNEDDDDNDKEDKTDSADNEKAGYPPARSSTNEPEAEFYENRAQALQRPDRRQGSSNTRLVPTPKPVANGDAWDIPAIQCHEPEDGVFYAQIGPTGGKHGYSAITGHVGWGISWFINGLLIPEIHVVRGKTYTFVVEGGNNPDIPAKYHPFYITDDPVGGYEHKREEEKKAVRIFAGVHRSRSGQITPTGVGRLCNWTPDVDGPPADDYQSFGAYQRTLTLKCDPGEPGVITWRPDQNTPDTVYYHCFTHRYLGWKIHVHDTCDNARYAASERHEVSVAAPEAEADAAAAMDFDAQSSIRHESKVSPNDNFLLKHQTDLIKNHNMNGTPPKLSFEITKSSEITKLISDGIRAAEALEESILLRDEVYDTRNQQFDKQQQSFNHLNSRHHNNQQQKTSPGQQHTKLNGGAVVGTGAAFLLHQQQTLNSAETTHQRHTHTSHNAADQKSKHLPTNVIKNHYSSQTSATQSQVPPIHAKIFHTKQQHHANSHNINAPSQPPSLPPAPPSSFKHYYNHHHHQNHNQINNKTKLPENLQKPIGLSEYLRPPQNSPYLQVVKLPGRRPFPEPIKKSAHVKPVLPQQIPPRRKQPSKHQLLAAATAAVPQPSVIVNHYRKPVPGLLPFLNKGKPFPIEPLAASVLLLGQPTNLNTAQQRVQEPILVPQHSKHKPKPNIAVPYSDLLPQHSFQENTLLAAKHEKKKPIFHVKAPHKRKPNLPVIESSSPASAFKKPINIVHAINEEPSPLDIATMKPAVNKGFQPDTVVVESGFKPIIRHDSIQPEAIEQVANRREDAGTEIDEVMETDTLFLTAQTGTQTQNFEPMFIPSPPDNNNTIIIRRVVVPSSLASSSSLALSSLTANKPITILENDLPPVAELLRNATIADLFESPDDLFDFSVRKKTQKPVNKLEELFNEKTETEISNESKNITENKVEEIENDSSKVALNENSNANLTRRTDTKQAAEYEIERHAAVAADAVNEDDEFEFKESDDYDQMMPADETDEYDDGEAQAAERIDTYYLPPDNRKIPHAQIPSGAVITYDGKSVIDSTLVLPPKLDASDVVSSSSSSNSTSHHHKQQQSQKGGGSSTKLEELIRNTPQFLPFRGEIPPPIPEFLSTEKSSLLQQQVSLAPSSLSPPLSASLLSSTSQQIPTSTSLSSPSPLPVSLSSSTSTSASSKSKSPSSSISTKLQILKSPA